MTVNAKTVVKAFYGANAKPVYFASCSNGGRQALMEAQRFLTTTTESWLARRQTLGSHRHQRIELQTLDGPLHSCS